MARKQFAQFESRNSAARQARVAETRADESPEDRRGRLHAELCDLVSKNGSEVVTRMTELVKEHGAEDVEWMVAVVREDFGLPAVVATQGPDACSKCQGPKGWIKYQNTTLCASCYYGPVEQ